MRRCSAGIPLLRVLEQHLKIEIEWAEQTMRATLADAGAASRLAVLFASPLMFAERRYFRRGGKPLQIAQSLSRADRYQFAVQLKRYLREGKWRRDYQGSPQ